MKKLKDYAPFYLGCECITPDGIMVLNGINATDSKHSLWFYCRWNDKKNCYLPKQNGDVLMKQSMVGKAYKYSEIKLILRPLSDIKHEELIELYEILNSEEDDSVWEYEQYKRNYAVINISGPEFKASVFHFLLSKHFDIFSLIDAGLAIDKTTLKQPK
jgi:hypothetical protein